MSCCDTSIVIDGINKSIISRYETLNSNVSVSNDVNNPITPFLNKIFSPTCKLSFGYKVPNE